MFFKPRENKNEEGKQEMYTKKSVLLSGMNEALINNRIE